MIPLPNLETPHAPVVPAAWVIGAGSGVGAAFVHELARRGFSIALSGRRLDRLKHTEAEAQQSYQPSTTAGKIILQPLDVTDSHAVAVAHAEIEALLGPVSIMVYAAGTNTPRRYWKDLTPDDTHAIYATNLVAPTLAVSLVLPAMREAGAGTIVLLSSLSARQHSPDAGVAYSASKRGLSTLAEHVNSIEGASGIRATAVVPGDIDTEFLSKRPHIPDAQSRMKMLTATEVAAAAAIIIDQPPSVCINELVITPVR